MQLVRLKFKASSVSVLTLIHRRCELILRLDTTSVEMRRLNRSSKYLCCEMFPTIVYIPVLNFTSMDLEH